MTSEGVYSNVHDRSEKERNTPQRKIGTKGAEYFLLGEALDDEQGSVLECT